MTEYISLLFRLEAGLLAFVLAFYALCARERKAPYITHTVYDEIGLTLASVLATLGLLVSPSTGTNLRCFLQFAAGALVSLAILFTMRRVYSIANRDLRLRDDRWWLAAPGIRQLYRFCRGRKHARKKGVSYEHQPVRPTPALLHAIVATGWAPKAELDRLVRETPVAGGPELSVTLSLLSQTFHDADDKLVRLATAFLREGAYVQYAPCGRHPTEFLLKLSNHWRLERVEDTKDWKEIANHVVVVDAYTPHFGFGESVHDARRGYIENQLGVEIISSSPTYAGIHTATAGAFNRIKKRAGKFRKPTLLIFETTYALVDLESPEQYRRFWRHVIPSERMWGSMFTVVAEQYIDSESEALLRSYSDFFHRDICRLPRNERLSL